MMVAIVIVDGAVSVSVGAVSVVVRISVIPGGVSVSVSVDSVVFKMLSGGQVALTL